LYLLKEHIIRKNEKLLFVAAILLFVSSCANDDTVIQLENSDLQGDWSMTSETEVGNETWKVTYTFSLSGVLKL
tara:strand:- start:153 stop:374 length:222 start_codon:yes stop_codon:yes gene_type:complete